LAFVKDWFAVGEQISSWFGFRSAATENHRSRAILTCGGNRQKATRMLIAVMAPHLSACLLSGCRHRQDLNDTNRRYVHGRNA
jgi:hypothetical protein